MKKLFKPAGIVLAALLFLFLAFLIEESVRLKTDDDALPLVILDRTKYSISAIEPGEELEIEYYSIGYKTAVRYYRPEGSAGDSETLVSGKEFMLFYKVRLWAWIS